MPARRMIVLAIAASACNYDWTYRPDAGSPPSSQKDAGGDPSTNEDSGAVKTPCSAGKQTCPTGQYCRFDDRICGASSGEGVCTDVSGDCKSGQVCTCNGTFDDGCTAQKNGIDVDEKGTLCGTGTGTFPCGATTCTTAKEACVTSSGGSKCATCAEGCKCTAFADCICKEAAPGEVSFECK